MVQLSKKPFYLKQVDIDWVHSSIEKMTLDQKIGQLFIGMLTNSNNQYLESILNRTMAAGFRYTSMDSKKLHYIASYIQERSNIPLLIASNTENGGKGAVDDGTHVGFELKVAATNDVNYAYQMGKISAHEAMVSGANMLFAPIVDITKNWRNPIIQTRTWGDTTKVVKEMSRAYLKGATEFNVACTIKHFPGDGVDERDHHLSSSVNNLSCQEWDESFGEIYKALIDDGVHAVMAGHIMLPSYQKRFNPDLMDDEILPATLSRELLGSLLRGKLGFNGVIVMDASHMVGGIGRTSRRIFVPSVIEAGCDLFLFHNDIEEDMYYMKEGLKNGLLSETRLQEALERILGLKASLGLHKMEKNKRVSDIANIDIVGNKEYKAIGDEVADKAITLAKNVGVSPLPLNKDRYKKILLVTLESDNPINRLLKGGLKTDIAAVVKNELDSYGFNVEIYHNEVKELIDKMSKMSSEEFNKFTKNPGEISAIIYGGKSSVEEFKKEYDIVLILANINAEMQTVNRITWTSFKGGYEKPWYVHETPTIFISFNSPFHLADVPQVKTLINCYDSQENTIKALTKKLIGDSPFKGVSPVDVFCGFPDTKL